MDMRADDICDVSAEAGVVATLIHHPEFYYHAEELLPQHFSDETNRIVYTAITNIITAGSREIDAYNIIEYLSSTPATQGYLSKISVDQLQELIANSDAILRSNPTDYKTLVSNVLNAAFRRDAYRKLAECQRFCVNPDGSDLATKIYTSIDEIMMGYSVTKNGVEIFRDKVDELWSEIVDRQEGRNKGIPFKFPSLNDYVQIESGELVVVGAPAKGAKSMFMLNEAVDILRQGKSVMYLDSELSSRLFLCRMVSHLTGIEFSRVRSGRYTPEEEARIREQLEWIKEQKFVHLYMPIFDRAAIYTAVKKTDHMFGDLDVLIVDYLKPTGSSTEAYSVYS